MGDPEKIKPSQPPHVLPALDRVSRFSFSFLTILAEVQVQHACLLHLLDKLLIVKVLVAALLYISGAAHNIPGLPDAQHQPAVGVGSDQRPGHQNLLRHRGEHQVNGGV